MTRLRSALADALEALLADGRVALTETRDGLALYRLLGRETKQILALLAAAAWDDVQISDQGGVMEANQIEDEDQDITLRVRKPGVPDGVEAILTRTGLEAALKRADLTPRLWVHGLNAAFDTLSIRYGPWGDSVVSIPQELPHSPRNVVRVLDDGARFPDDLGRWLLRDPSVSISGRGIEPWRRMAVEHLGQALADEIEPTGRLLFRGPPVTRFSPDVGPLVEAAGIEAIERVALWVFDNPREVENRHVLVAAEIARTALRGGDATDLAAITASAFEGARIAYSFGITQQSRDTLKALGELRKAVSDETGRLADTTRGLATAITGSVVANLGIIVARLTVPATSTWAPAAAIVLSVVLALYVASVIASGAQYLQLQATLRNEWRSRLYRFLDDPEYARMVTDPVRRAERGFWIAAIAGGAMAALLFAAVWLIAGKA
ncbi:hypothetical protein U1839_17915 [Sphingomonas sp. RT2P30]|uniref:hypothetical protein n=1 Tax=Parasphingomonas halimpatiens TaxID=3096162 RepID=UPI002FC62DAE